MEERSGWYAELNEIESKGSQGKKPGSLAGLAEARRQHMGQFFTPEPLAKLMWDVALQTAAGFDPQRPITLLDNSVGSGRLLQFATPGKHSLYGVDIDQESLTALGNHVEEAGFYCEFNACGMQSIRPAHFDIGLINPPFSLHIESPLLKPYPCTAYGKYGPNTSALSHAYALAQIVDACQAAIALLPSTFAQEVVMNPQQFLDEDNAKRLAAHIELPPGLFRQENTDVSVSLLVFGPQPSQPKTIRVKDISQPLPDLGIVLKEKGNARLNVTGITDDGPAITLPVTGSKTVRIGHNGRKIILGFQCGLVQAKVLNGIYRNRISEDGPVEYRRPKGFEYAGQGALDMEVHLVQQDPAASFQNLIELVRKSGGDPVVYPGTLNYLKKKTQEHIRKSTPYRHWVFIEEGTAGNSDTLTGKALKNRTADPKVWGSPLIKAGQDVTFKRRNGHYEYDMAGKTYSISTEALHQDFKIGEGAERSGWHLVHKGLVEAFPDIAQNIKATAIRTGIDKWLTWGYQLYDLVEIPIKPGATVAWDMGLGKARLAIALIILTGCKRGLITVEAGLVDEMVMELKGLPIDKDDWQVIATPEHLKSLRKINVISYERLRMPIKRGNRKDTYAKRLRRRIGLLVADEGDLLANPESDQSRAIMQVSPRRKFTLSGTPLPNYPRDILPIMAYTSGDCTSSQPWGWRNGYLEQNWRQSVSYARRGIDAFRDTFITMEWVTNQFADTLLEGAKREVPRITNLAKYRAMIAPHVKRRTINEPEVREHITIPPETRSIVEVPWDESHLAHYLRVADGFASWYRKKKEEKANNLVAILARIRAVTFASDYPQHSTDGFGSYPHLTSKQRWVIDELEKLTRAGRKTILYAENPEHLELIARHLDSRGVESVIFHGKKQIHARTSELNKRFRFGDCPNMLASIGVTQKGLNLWQANEVILLSRSWSARTEEQAIRRTLRPQQKANVRVRYVHLPGGIDIYKDQMVAFKKDASDAGLDWGTPKKSDEEFLHIDTVLERFVEGIATLRNMTRHELREYLRKEEHSHAA